MPSDVSAYRSSSEACVSSRPTSAATSPPGKIAKPKDKAERKARKKAAKKELAKVVKVPADALRETLDAYNDAAEGKSTDRFGKDPEKMHAMRSGPYYAINAGIRSKRFPCPTLTLGGLVVDERTGQVQGEDGRVIPGLYAAGRNAVGVCSRQYVSGLSIADCVYSGRRAGGAAARGEVYAEDDAPTPAQSTPIEAKPSLDGLPVLREAQVADLREADLLARLFLELVVEIHGVLVDLADAVAHVEQW